MFNTLKKFLYGLGIVLGIVFVVFVVNQFVNLYNLSYKIHPYFAMAMLVALSATLLYFLIRLLILWFGMPKVLTLSENATKEEYDLYVDNIIGILRKNKNLKRTSFDNEILTKENLIANAFEELDELSLPIIKSNANAVFLSTAISQNGSLDSILLLTTMTRMIWQLAKIYQTRPTIKSLGKLYIQVAGVVFMARSLEDMDLIEDQMEPLIASILGESIASAIPGMVPITNLVVSSLMEGSVNAFLTLRVGLVTQSYLGMEVPQTRALIKRNASTQAISYMGSIIKDNGKFVIKAIGKSVKKATGRTAKRWFGKSDPIV